jgi:hypothetical protein
MVYCGVGEAVGVGGLVRVRLGEGVGVIVSVGVDVRVGDGVEVAVGRGVSLGGRAVGVTTAAGVHAVIYESKQINITTRRICYLP